MWKEWKFLATTVKRYSALEKKCMITFQNITHSNDVLCRTERSMERLVFFLFLYQFLARMNLAILVNVVILVILVCNVITMIL